MAGVWREGFSGTVNLTPHKIAVCHLIQFLAPAADTHLPLRFRSVSDHNRLGLFLFSLTRACNDYMEPPLDQLITQFKGVSVGGFEYNCFDDRIIDDLTSCLSALSSPDDLYNFFEKLRGILSPSELTNTEEEQCYLDPSSHLGLFIRCCILAFGILSFEGVSHLLSNMNKYCNPTEQMYELPEDTFHDDIILHESLDYSELNYASRKYSHNLEAGGSAAESSFHMLDDFQVPAGSKFKSGSFGIQDDVFTTPISNIGEDSEYHGDIFLRSKWQIQGYLNGQADLLERHAGSFPCNTFGKSLENLQKMAPNLHHVKYLRYLNNLYDNDYLSALENLHRYFDYSAGMEGIFTGSSAPPLPGIQVGRYESALLCVGTMHARFGHSKLALEALTEAVRVSQQNGDDSCLSYTLATMCDLLSKIGMAATNVIIGSQYSLGLGTPLSTQQQLLVLLKQSLKRAENLKLTYLIAFSRLALARFHLKHVERSVLFFGSKASKKLGTDPSLVCKELRISSNLLFEFSSDGLSVPSDNGFFSTAWLNKLEKPINSPDKLINPIPGPVLQLTGASYLLRATSWELYGSAPLVRANALIYVSCFADSVSSSDLALAYGKLIQHLAVFKGYKEAFSALKLAEKKFSSMSKSPIHLLKCQLLHEWALHRGQLKLAQRLCDEFGTFASSTTGVDLDLKTEASMRLARTLLAANQFTQAVAVADSLFCQCYKFNLQIESASVLLLLAEIHRKSGNSVVGLSYAFASLSFCRIFNLDLLEASATLTIAELWLSLGHTHAERASCLVNCSLPMILGHGGLELRARANIALVKCHLCDPSFLVSNDPDIVLDLLRQAAEELETLEYHEMAAEAFYMTAMVYDALGKIEEREDAASSFKNHIHALEKYGYEDEPENMF